MPHSPANPLPRRLLAPAGFTPVPGQPFQVALTMAGAVSAGAYTAGVLDFFVEALDAWRAKVAEEAALDPSARTVPWHHLQLRAVSGASAGSMAGAILALTLHRRFPPVRACSPVADQEANPFYRTWVRCIGIRALLGTRDLDGGGPVVSLLDATPLEDILDELMAPATVAPPRDWLNPAVTFRFTLTSLDPQAVQSRMEGYGASGHRMWFHRAHAAFQLSLEPPADPDLTWLDAGWLAQGGDPRLREEWQAFGQASLASGGFPFFLRGRRTEVRLRASFQAALPRVLRVQHRPDGLRLTAGAPADANPFPAGSTGIFAVDGGALNNEPLELARRDLLRPGQLRNPRSGTRACAAVVMVAPFPNQEATPAPLRAQTPLRGLVAPFLAAWAHDARFRPEEIFLAERESIYSRYILAPVRRGAADPRIDRGPLASGALGAFLGFFSMAFRHHDFLLGRRNAQQFLRAHFPLPAHHPLFLGMEHLHGRWGHPHQGKLHLPLIPLVGACALEEPLPPWPRGDFDPKTLVDPLRTRLLAVLSGLSEDLGPMWGTLLRFFRRFIAWELRGTILKTLRKAVQDADL